MFRPVQMQRVRILALKNDQAKVVQILHEFGAVQLEQADRASFFREATPPDYARKIADEAFRFEGLATSLPRVTLQEQMVVGGVDDILSKASQITIDDEVKRIKIELENIDVRLNRFRNYLDSLRGISGFEKDLSVLSSKSLSVAFYTVPIEHSSPFSDAVRALSKDSLVIQYTATKDDETVLVAIPSSSQEAARSVFEKFRAVRLELPSDLGTPQEASKKIIEGIRDLEARKQENESALLELSKQYYSKVLALREALSIESARFEALGRGGQSERTFVVEGWVPINRVSELESKLDSKIDHKLVIQHIHSNDVPPTLLQNSRRINYFEFFVRFFSLPQSEEIDPTWTIAIVFPIFFGMMLGDVGYGIVILLIGIWFARIASGRANTRRLPMPLRKFGKSLMPKRALGQLGKILIPSALIGILFGVLVNAYFGFRIPSYAPLFDLERSPQIFLIITLFVGLAHVTLGYVYGIFIALHEGNKKHAYAKVGWIGFLWSGVAAIYFALSGVLGAPVPSYVEYAGLGGLIVFGAIVAVFEKVRFVMEIPTLISHVVSYGRILGVLLASFLLASIASVGIQSSVSGPISSLLIAFVVFILVSILNIVLGIFEPSIQGIRLHYVEFYSKFFEGNGKRFQPFAERRVLTKKAEA